MTDWREVSGETREAAIQEAMRVLGVAENDMEIAEVPGADDEVKLVVRMRADENAGVGEEEHAPTSATAESDDADGEADVDAEVSGEDSEDGDDELAAQIEQQKDVVLDFLVDLLEAFDLEGEIAAEVKDRAVNVDVSGEDLGSLIGRRGKTLGALSEIAKTVVQRRTAARVRLNLDVQGYRVRRREVLEGYADQLAQDVKSSNVEKALEPMPAAERKIVHDVVAKVDGVRSYSEGTEPKRNVVISPA